MSEELLARVFEPFFTTKEAGKGTGLGLGMVRGVAIQLGGTVTIGSRLGHGTSVSIWLPRANPEQLPRARREDVRQEGAQPTPTPEAAGHSLRVLLVDDDFVLSMSAADMLMDRGHTVVQAASGTHALQLLESDAQFDAMLTDYAMPGMNGLDLAIKARRAKPDLLIVLATGYEDLPPHTTTLSFPRLAKPYTQEQLAKVLETAVNTVGSEESAGDKPGGGERPTLLEGAARLSTLSDRGAAAPHGHERRRNGAEGD